MTNQQNTNQTENTVVTNLVGMQPWAAIFSIDNTSIENYVVNLFGEKGKVSPYGAILLTEQRGKTSGNDLRDSLSLLVYFRYEDFTGKSAQGSVAGINPLLAQQMPLNTNIAPIDELMPLLARTGKVVDGKPAKYIVTPARGTSGPLVEVQLDIHAILRIMLLAPTESFVISVMSSETNREGDQVVLTVSKSIASNGNQTNTNNNDLRDLARGTSRGSSRGGQRSFNNNNQRTGQRGW